MLKESDELLRAYFYPLCGLSEEFKEFNSIFQIRESQYLSQILRSKLTVAEVPSFIDFAPAHRPWAVRSSEKFNKSQIEILKVISHQKLNTIELI